MPGTHMGVCHVGLYSRDPVATALFYRDVMGMEIVGGGAADHPVGAHVFLSSRPDEEAHEVALFANPDIRHVAFKVRSLPDLRSFYDRVFNGDLPVKAVLDNRVAYAFYFDDPDGNMIEIYWPTGTPDRLPVSEPLDLTQTEDALYARLKKSAQPAPKSPSVGSPGLDACPRPGV